MTVGGDLANYIYIPPLAAISSAILMIVWGMPVWMVVLSFLVAGSVTALAIALAIFFLSDGRREKARKGVDNAPHRHSAATDF